MKFWGVRIGSIALALGAVFLLQAISGSFDGFTQRLIVLAALYVTLSVSLNLINGITGQFSIGHAAFYQVGAYAAFVLAQEMKAPAGMPPALWLVVSMLAGAAAAGIAGLVVGLPSLRLRGDYLAIVTLGFGEIVRIFVNNQPWLGASYGTNVPPIKDEVIKDVVLPMAWLLAIVCVAVCRNLLKTAHGLPFLAVREDEIAARAMGVNITATKVIAFIVGSAFAGAAGSLLAHYEMFISPAMFTMDVSFIILTMVVLGGTGSITGSVIAAILLFYLPEKMRDLQNVPMGMIAASAIAVVAAVVILRRIGETFHGSAKAKAARIVGTIVASVAAAAIIGTLLSNLPNLSTAVEGSKLRLVVFAMTLIVLMLLRPQGIFGHHEFSWSWVRKLFGAKDVPTTEVAA